MRLDHFLPFLRKPKIATRNRARLYYWTKHLLPGPLFTHASSPRQQGLIRRLLRFLGAGWLSSPWRRLVQAGCFVLFLFLFFYTCWPYSASPDPKTTDWPSHYADEFAAGQFIEAETFLALDPLLSISTALAGRTWIWSLAWAAVILASGLLIPRGFCGYICPLGTLIDLFDWSLGKRVKNRPIPQRGWWVHLKYYLLFGTLIAALGGVLLSGFVAAIPVITRGFMFVLAPLQLGISRGWHQVPPLNAGHIFSILLFVAVLALGFLRPRFWCRYVCPTGALFSLGNIFARTTERKVESSCIDCNKCVEACPFDAIKPDFTTRTADCTLCQTCGGVCPTHAIKFVDRWDQKNLKAEHTGSETPVSRRGFAAAMVSGLVITAGIKATPASPPPVRPPMSVPEADFLDMCIRCGECFKVCPNSVLQPMSFNQGLDNLWTPYAAADWAGCEPSCNNCGQACPTGAIRALPIAEKKVARMGLAQIKETCLPWAGESACQLCVDECTNAGYNALEFERVHPQVDQDGFPIEGTGFSAPVLITDSCVGCGLCQSACHRTNVTQENLLAKAAIIVYAGPGKEDRIHQGSYTDLRKKEKERIQSNTPPDDFY